MSKTKNLILHRRMLFILFLIILIQPFSPVQAKLGYDTSYHTADVSTATIMRGEVEVTKNPGAFEGYNLFVLRERDIENRQNNQTLIIADMEGNVEYERIITNSGLYELADVSVEFVNPTTVLVGYPFRTAFVNIINDTERFHDFYGHHEYEYNPNNDTVFTFKYHSTMINGSEYLFDLIAEYDLDGNMVWSLDVSDFITPDMWCPYLDLFGGNPDITHSNTAFYDADEDVIYYNPRNVNTFYKIDHKTGNVIWSLGEYGDFDMYNSVGVRVDDLFFHSHSLERVDEDTFILFDNDHHNQNNQANHKSRMLEITIYEDTMEAHQSWSWTPPDGYWSFLWGDADRLPNGNRLGVFGASSHPGSEDGAQLVEVTENGDIAWRFNFKTNEVYRYGVYRMERFRYTPILDSPPDAHFIPSEEVMLEWQAWYNYRPKKTIMGSYILTMDNTQIDSSTFLYDRFWRPSKLNFNLGILEPGDYELTLEITNDVGFKSNDTILVNVSEASNLPLMLGVPLGIAGIVAIIVVLMKRR
ncbi:MAG: aryl-sulfate sulfotransferase [Candidatus Thorarchaeota archaeon]